VDSIDNTDQNPQHTKKVNAVQFGSIVRLDDLISPGSINIAGLRYPGMERLMANQETSATNTGIQCTVGMNPTCIMLGGCLQSFQLNWYGRAIDQGAGINAGIADDDQNYCTITISSSDPNFNAGLAVNNQQNNEVNQSGTIYTPADFGLPLYQLITYNVSIKLNVHYGGSLSSGNVSFTSNYSLAVDGLKFISRT
jgi:hypothetical protein